MNKQIFFFFTLVLCTCCLTALSQPRIIAHRGYWKTDGSAQNSIAALLKADSMNIVYGSEIDVWLSSDGVPVVHHDADAKLDGQRLRVQETPASVLRQVKLANGEPLPTLEEYLTAFEKCKNIRLIIEYKVHESKAREDELTQKVMGMIRDRGLQNKVEYISFGVNFIHQVRKIDPNALVYYLNGDLSPRVLSAMGAAGFDYHYDVLYKYPHWVKQAHDSGMKVNAWTVNKPEDIQKVIDLKVDFITTDEPSLVYEMLPKQ